MLEAKLTLHPLLASAEVQLSHHACLVESTTWQSQSVSFLDAPDGSCTGPA